MGIPYLYNAHGAHAMNAITLNPTWKGMLPYLLAALENGTPEGKRIAREELQKMADAADFAANVADKQTSEKPRRLITDREMMFQSEGLARLRSPTRGHSLPQDINRFYRYRCVNSIIQANRSSNGRPGSTDWDDCSIIHKHIKIRDYQER